jgi:multicomponent Na+:H+ antiporter subunit A
MLVAVLSGFLLAPFAPLVCRITRNQAGWFLSMLPFAITAYLLTWLGTVTGGGVVQSAYTWVPALDIALSFYLDSLALTFALLISGIGGLVVAYTGGYLNGHPDIARFYAYTLMFMGSMLGVVLADNVITLFVFWELTSLTSYLLIGFDHGRAEARRAALQALLVTGIGGLALLAGLVLLGTVADGYELSAILQKGDQVREHALYGPILVLVLLGAFTKSAQFPFHFWLPNAMEAPTPASAYLHSSTMVKAGVYLLARLSPVLGGTPTWAEVVTGFGLATMVIGACMAVGQSYLKRLLAYSTVSALGAMVMLLGVGTESAVVAAMAFLLAHAFYKAGLFLVAGIVDHESGERDVRRLAGLRDAMPVTAAAAGLAALSMAGLPPLFGFIGKELMYEATLHSHSRHGPFDNTHFLTGAALVTNMLFVAVAALVAYKPFFGKRRETPKHPHEAPPRMWLGPVVLGVLGLAAALAPRLIAEPLVAGGAAAVAGRPIDLSLALWHGLNPALALSAATLAGGALIYAIRGYVYELAAWLGPTTRLGPDRWYDVALRTLKWTAGIQTRVLQSGYLRYYLLLIVATTVSLAGYTLLSRHALHLPKQISEVRFYEAGLAGLILLAIGATVHSRSRLGAIAALGVVGYSVALVFVLYGAPDLAMTQFVIETLTVILFVFAFYHLRPYTVLSRIRSRTRDLVVAIAAGTLMTALVLAAGELQFHPSIAEYFARESYATAHGRNIVNVILVDFRGIDTMGEITVLAVAAVGAYALLKLRLGGKPTPPRPADNQEGTRE